MKSAIFFSEMAYGMFSLLILVIKILYCKVKTLHELYLKWRTSSFNFIAKLNQKLVIITKTYLFPEEKDNDDAYNVRTLIG